MDYRISLNERVDENGMSAVTLFFEIHNQVFRITRFFKDKGGWEERRAIAECFKEMARLLPSDQPILMKDVHELQKKETA